MANHPSSLKRHRQSLKRRQRNRAQKDRIKLLTRQLGEAGKTETPELVKKLQSALVKAGRHGVLHRKTAARMVSKAMAPAAEKSS